MKRINLYSILGLCLLLFAGCGKDKQRSDRQIRTISGLYHHFSNEGDDRKAFSYSFTYDEAGRITSIDYTGELYLYGEGLIRGDYTYETVYNGSDTEVTVYAKNTVIKTDKQTIPYDGIPEQEKLPLVFNGQGDVVSITGRPMWFYVKNTTLAYENEYPKAIREDNEAYYKREILFDWKEGNLVSETENEIGRNGQVNYSTLRKFHFSSDANDYSIDLNWLTGDLGLNYQHGLTPLALMGLLGHRSGHLLESITETDETPVTINFTRDENTITGIAWESMGGSYTYTITY